MRPSSFLLSSILCSVVWSGGVARAESLTWRIEDPGLRRKTQLVYVERFDGKVTAPSEPTFMNQHGNVYLPHVLPVVVGTKLIFKSEDPELHNVYARGEKRVLFNDAIVPKTQSIPREFKELGVVHLTCNIHKEMSAYVVVLQNPYFALPEKDGTVTIANLPTGSYTLRVWGEQLSDEQKAKTFPVVVKAGGAS
jgi:plastocyanin